MGQEERPGQRALDLIASALKVTHQLNEASHEAYPRVPYLPRQVYKPRSYQVVRIRGHLARGSAWVPRYLGRGVHVSLLHRARSAPRTRLLVRV